VVAKPTTKEARLRNLVRNIPDFPKKGIVFRDITTLLLDHRGLKDVADIFFNKYTRNAIDKVAGIESRGFLFGSILAHSLNVGFVPIRKPGKLPSAVERQTYQLEYGTDAVEIHKDAIKQGDRILLHDDLLATGGTMLAASQLVERLGGTVVGISFLIELAFLGGRDRLKKYDVFSIISYEEE
jgi:adenine phosphoribosyltransferase